MKKENPWAAKHRDRTGTSQTKSLKNSAGISSGKPMKKVLIRSRPRSPESESKSLGKKHLIPVAVGSYVKLSWRVDPAYGAGLQTFKGSVAGIDDWITVVDHEGVICHMPLSYVKVELL